MLMNEALNVLESKIARLLELVAELRMQNAKLTEENMRLKEHVEVIEHSLLKNHQNLEELNQEKHLTRMVVDDLIKDIDLLVKGENQA